MWLMGPDHRAVATEYLRRTTTGMVEQIEGHAGWWPLDSCAGGPRSGREAQVRHRRWYVASW
ncbi:MAG: hypothetical protein KatS3mg111_2770 [Pirellulaceae bacterium]|nr:MAG: hypothetical protein KatS3mg111_2770 [Pirellulaceae bacterium]